MTQLGRFLDPRSPEPPDPRIHALFVYNANPVVTTPHQDSIVRGLARHDLFTVVHEQVMTDTARWADIVLPAATFLEGTDLKVSYGDYVAGGVRPVVEPVGESRTNMQLFGALGRRLGMVDEAFTWSDEELLRRGAGALRLAGEAAPAAVGGGGRQRYGFHGETPVQFETVAPQTEDGRIHLTPEALGPEPFVWQPLESAHPLALITPASSRLVTSTFGESNLETLIVTVSPEDAERRGVESGHPVRVFNDLGEVHCLARVSPKVRPGVVSMPKGAWQRSSLNGATSTALTPDHAQQVGGAACFNDARVELEPLER
jgi:anaerobic selenocysteine-containing dehydrogenase